MEGDGGTAGSFQGVGGAVGGGGGGGRGCCVWERDKEWNLGDKTCVWIDMKKVGELGLRAEYSDPEMK